MPGINNNFRMIFYYNNFLTYFDLVLIYIIMGKEKRVQRLMRNWVGTLHKLKDGWTYLVSVMERLLATITENQLLQTL